MMHQCGLSIKEKYTILLTIYQTPEMVKITNWDNILRNSVSSRSTESDKLFPVAGFPMNCG